MRQGEGVGARERKSDAIMRACIDRDPVSATSVALAHKSWQLAENTLHQFDSVVRWIGECAIECRSRAKSGRSTE